MRIVCKLEAFELYTYVDLKHTYAGLMAWGIKPLDIVQADITLYSDCMIEIHICVKDGRVSFTHMWFSTQYTRYELIVGGLYASLKPLSCTHMRISSTHMWV